ncbi:LamG domain-containing protein [Streptomyces sudanensis]|uniref:LamG domain-containing protein n=1 Tax=Streptomyces sudanensis TaxID=436397 RepID=A0ABY4TA27_9ACTN|nr:MULTISPECIES: LamG domain-containing protein [Streptomyces]URN14798.1 LamG domain-containing protein [Streptomyces sudanensis]
MNSAGNKRSRERRRRLVVGGLATALLALPGTAHATGNLPPLQPLVQNLETGGRPCAVGGELPYVDGPPTLGAVLHDPEEDDRPGEGNMVEGRFEAWWTDAAGTEQRRTHTTTSTVSGTRHTWRMPEDTPADTVISWHVRASDGTAASAWSDEGGGSVCQFVRDDTSPRQPVVTSSDHPDEEPRGGVGEYVGFTVDSPSDDVVAYRYEFTGGPSLTVGTGEPGGPATIRHLSLREGPTSLDVQAVDRAGRVSAASTYRFTVRPGRAPVAHWTLSDAPGSTVAAARSGPAAGAGSGVVFGTDGPRGASVASVATLDGSSHGFLTPNVPVLDSRKTFAVSAWTRPASTDRNATVVSQDAGGDAGFVLGLRAQDEGPLWSFAVGGTRVVGGTPENGRWTHLLGLYDAETGRARLYVDGREVGSGATTVPSATTTGAFQIGRARNGDGYRDRWQGEIGDVRVHDRVVVPDELTELAHRRPVLLGHWSLENAAGGTSPERNGGKPLALGPGAAIHRGPDGSCIPGIDPDCPDVPYALVGDGHLQLDGTAGYATTGTPLVDTEESFTVGVVVRLTDPDPVRPMTVLSQAGENTDVFKVRYDPSAQAWQLVMPQRDEVGAPETVVSQISAAEGGWGPGRRLAVVQDRAAGRVSLYLDGQTGPGATASLPEGLRSSGALQIGRAKAGDGWGEYLHGDVDEVQVYAGALSGTHVQHLGTGVDLPLG